MRLSAIAAGGHHGAKAGAFIGGLGGAAVGMVVGFLRDDAPAAPTSPSPAPSPTGPSPAPPSTGDGGMTGVHGTSGMGTVPTTSGPGAPPTPASTANGGMTRVHRASGVGTGPTGSTQPKCSLPDGETGYAGEGYTSDALAALPAKMPTGAGLDAFVGYAGRSVLSCIAMPALDDTGVGVDLGYLANFRPNLATRSRGLITLPTKGETRGVGTISVDPLAVAHEATSWITIPVGDQYTDTWSRLALRRLAAGGRLVRSVSQRGETATPT